MINRNSRYAALLLAGSVLGAAPSASYAADAADSTSSAKDEIVIVAQRQQYRGDVPFLKQPQTVQQIDGALLQSLNITKLDAALDLASGVARQNNFGGLWDSFAIRGFAGDESYPSGFLVNGFNGGRGFGGPRDASNVEKIEILKGPNGAVFGRGEPGGTVNIITKKADINGTFGSLTGSAASYNAYRGEADVNLKVSNTVAVRVNGAIEDGDNFRGLHYTKKVATPSIRWQPSDDTSLTYEMEYVDQKVPFDRGTIAINGVLGLVPRTTFLGEPGDGPMRVKVLGHQLQFSQSLGGSWAFLAGVGYRDTSFRGYSSDPELVAGRQTLVSTGNMLARQRRYRDFDTNDAVLRAEISGKFYTGGIANHLVAGADWDRFRIDFLQRRFRPSPYTAGAPITAANNAINVFAPVYGQLPVPNVVLTNTHEVQTAYGLYFQDQIDLTDHFKIRAGGRFDHFHQVILGVTPPVDVTRNKFSPSVGAIYDLTDTLSLYASFGTGFRPNSGVNFAGNSFAPETSKSYEAGLRFVSLDKKITGSLAAFTMTKTNVLTVDPAHAGFSMTAGSARSSGFEADINARLPGDFTVIANYAYTDAHWTTSLPDPGGFGLTLNPGDPLINIPKHAANLLVTKDFDLGSAGKAMLGGGINYVGRRLGETGVNFYLPGYTLTRLTASYAPIKRVKVSVDVTNLFDITYYPASYARYWVAPGTPRTVTGRVTVSF